MKKNLAATMAVVAAITLAATMMTFAGITTITQQAYAQPSNTGSNTGTCSNKGTASGGSTVIQYCNNHQGWCVVATQDAQVSKVIISHSDCS
jgi:hypothetical protein